MNSSTQARILRRIRSRGRGAVFTPTDFLDVGTRDAVDKALSRLQAKGQIRRLDRGIYDYPRTSRRTGHVSPDPDQVARSLAAKAHARVHRSGAFTANALGLSTQVPAKAVYVTDGPGRRVSAGATTVVLKSAAPRNLVGAGTVSGDVFQALRHLGRNGVDDRTVATLRRRLSPADKKQLARDADQFIGWMRPVVARVTGRRIP
jgi:hypothetical protein